eukprot:5586792-Amphidinium_carterae.1
MECKCFKTFSKKYVAPQGADVLTVLLQTDHEARGRTSCEISSIQQTPLVLTVSEFALGSILFADRCRIGKVLLSSGDVCS